MKRSMQGFTLIEIMIVALIIGMTASLIAISIGDNKADKAPKTEAEAFVHAVDFVSEYAALNGEVIGMFAVPKNTEDSLGKKWCYDWKRNRANEWVALPEDSLVEHCMAESVQWEMVIEGHVYVYDPDLEIQPPTLVFSPSGETTAVEMSMFEEGTTNTETQHIQIDLMGGICWPEGEKDQDKDPKDICHVR
ncbi:MAG: type II secretion system protein [Gammaproteobacteria bacterium]|nr:MAG: type II secretion system protein [Gammaproteobacteria bacterium]